MAVPSGLSAYYPGSQKEGGEHPSLIGALFYLSRFNAFRLLIPKDRQTMFVHPVHSSCSPIIDFNMVSIYIKDNTVPIRNIR